MVLWSDTFSTLSIIPAPNVYFLYFCFLDC
jgi:hypothetical protein